MRIAAILPLSLALACTADPTADADAESGSEVGSGSTADAGDSAADETGDATSTLPCDVAAILDAHCGSCHGAAPSFGAPMALVDYADLQVPAVTDPTRPVSALVAERMVDDQRPMPPTHDVSAADLAIVLDWIAAGTPSGTETCDPIDETGGPDDPPYELPCEPSVTFTAHGDAEGTGFDVPLVDDIYQCFTFASPFSGDEQGIAWAPIIDDERVIHHWLLLHAPEGTEPGMAGPCGDQFGGNGALLMGWAPGAPAFTLPDDVGLELPGPGEVLMLQIHYNNIAGYTDASDASGVALCTEPARANAAASIWLGTVRIDIPPNTTGYSTAGDCDTSFLDEPVNILSSWPHMHELGESLTTEILRGGDEAAKEPLVAVDGWNFNNQIYHPHSPAVPVNPGDVLRTTCTYDNDSDTAVTVGEGTGDEMCFNFALVYPIDAFGPNAGRRKCGLL
jgi:hypothetical protein